MKFRIGVAILLLAPLVALGAGCGTSNGGGSGGSDPGTGGTGTGGTGGNGTGTGGHGGAGACSTDADCTAGSQWCVAGACVACDNNGPLCDIACIDGWQTYERNGCLPCACAPSNECSADADCGTGKKCYAGAFCWDWCPVGDPSCCYGNRCSDAGCADPIPLGCFDRGCPIGQECTDTGCFPSGCGCSGGSWTCTADCGGGTCVSP